MFTFTALKWCSLITKTWFLVKIQRLIISTVQPRIRTHPRERICDRIKTNIWKDMTKMTRRLTSLLPCATFCSVLPSRLCTAVSVSGSRNRIQWSGLQIGIRFRGDFLRVAGIDSGISSFPAQRSLPGYDERQIRNSTGTIIGKNVALIIIIKKNHHKKH